MPNTFFWSLEVWIIVREHNNTVNSFSHFNRYHERRKTTSRTVFARNCSGS